MANTTDKIIDENIVAVQMKSNVDDISRVFICDTQVSFVNPFFVDSDKIQTVIVTQQKFDSVFQYPTDFEFTFGEKMIDNERHKTALHYKVQWQQIVSIIIKYDQIRLQILVI